jgi:scyllo-inositol 2-dehydrogenase (NADP+)
MIRVGLVGFGMAGRVFHAPMISAVVGLELAGVVERNSRDAEKAFPGVATYDSLPAMLSDPSIELVVVATSNTSHIPLALEAVDAGRHVVVDKPVGISSDEIGMLVRKASERGKLAIPFHNRRFDGDFRTLQRILRERMLGEVVSIESTFDRWRPAFRGTWRDDGTPGGGLLLDLGTHLADQAFFLFGLPEAVSAEVRIERAGGVTVDAFTIRLIYGSMIVTLGANCLAAAPRPRYLVRGSSGNFVKWGLDPQEDRLKASGRVIEHGWGEEPASLWGTLSLDRAQSGVVEPAPVKTLAGDYRLYYSAVRDAILGKAAPPVLATDAWHVAKLLEAAERSWAERRVIDCDWKAAEIG